MPQVKAGKVIKPVRLPDEVFGWLTKRAEYNGATVSAEIGRLIREEQAREQDRAAKQRALAPAAA
jgi:hypothetical protein